MKHLFQVLRGKSLRHEEPTAQFVVSSQAVGRFPPPVHRLHQHRSRIETLRDAGARAFERAMGRGRHGRPVHVVQDIHIFDDYTETSLQAMREIGLPRLFEESDAGKVIVIYKI